MLLLGTYESWKSGSVDADNGVLAMMILSGELLPKYHTGVYLVVGGGVGKTDTSRVDFGTLTDAGVYYNASPKCRFFLGGTCSNVSKMTVYAVKFTVSINASFK